MFNTFKYQENIKRSTLQFHFTPNKWPSSKIEKQYRERQKEDMKHIITSSALSTDIWKAKTKQWLKKMGSNNQEIADGKMRIHSDIGETDDKLEKRTKHCGTQIIVLG